MGDATRDGDARPRVVRERGEGIPRPSLLFPTYRCTGCSGFGPTPSGFKAAPVRVRADVDGGSPCAARGAHAWVSQAQGRRSARAGHRQRRGGGGVQLLAVSERGVPDPSAPPTAPIAGCDSHGSAPSGRPQLRGCSHHAAAARRAEGFPGTAWASHKVARSASSPLPFPRYPMSTLALQFTIGELPDYATALTLANLLRLAHTVAERNHLPDTLPYFAPNVWTLLGDVERLQRAAESLARSSAAWELDMAEYRRRIADGCQHPECGAPLAAHTRAGDWQLELPDDDGTLRATFGHFSHGCPSGAGDDDGRPLCFEPLPLRTP